MQSLLVLVVLIPALVSGQTASQSGAKSQCQLLIQDVDRTLKNFMFMSNEIIVPQNPSSMDAYCKEMLPVSRKASRYASACEKGFLRQVTQIFAASIRKPTTSICRKKRKESIDSFSCFNSEFQKKLRVLPATLLRTLNSMARNSSTEEIIPTFCCAFALNLQQVTVLKAPKCQNGSIDLREFIHSQVSSVVGDILDLMCGPLKTVENCQKQAEKVMVLVKSPLESDFQPDKAPFVTSILKAFSRLSE